MKSKVIMVCILFLLLSCSKNDSQQDLLYYDYILAGERNISRKEGILFTEIEPVPRILADNYLDLPIDDNHAVDINNDGIKDYQFFRSRSFSDDFDSLRITCLPLNNNAVLTLNSYPEWVDTLTLWDTIHSESHWINNSSIIFHTYINHSDTTKLGLWQDASNKYIGVRTMANDVCLYGWIRIHVSQSWGDNLVLFDYASTVGYGR